jgi:uncharacterized delta-60 repeat protein
MYRNNRRFLIVFAALIVLFPGLTGCDGTIPPHTTPTPTLLPMASGKILIGGVFTTIGGIPRNNIARINPDGSLDEAFSPVVSGIGNPPNSGVSVIVVDNYLPNTIIVGGNFSSLGGSSHKNIGRLYSDGLPDVTYNPSTDFGIHAIASKYGEILIGGDFKTINGQTRNGIGRLFVDGRLDPKFIPPFEYGSEIYNLAYQSDGKIYVAGYLKTNDFLPTEYTAPFTNGGEAPFNKMVLVRLNNDGSLDQQFKPILDCSISAFAVQPDGQIIVGGSYATLVESGTEPGFGALGHPCFYRLNHDDGSVDESFTRTEPDSTLFGVFTIAIQTDGKIIIGGILPNMVNRSSNYLARINPDGSYDESFKPIIVGDASSLVLIRAIALQTDAHIIIGGEFYSVDGQIHRDLARLNLDGSVDPSFTLGTNEGTSVISAVVILI